MNQQPETPIKGTVPVVVDYDHVDETAATLDANKIDTVISTLNFAAAEGQLSLIAAADKASATKRFIPSEFAAYNPPE